MELHLKNKKALITFAIIIIGVITGLVVSGQVASKVKTLPLKNCGEAIERGLGPITSDSIYYNPALDRDGDGRACE